jgi:hypothetical protein
MYSYGMLLFEILKREIPFSEFEQFFQPSTDASGQPVMVWKEMAIRDAIQSGLQPTTDNIKNDLLKKLMLMCWNDPSRRPSCKMVAHQIVLANPAWKSASVGLKSSKEPLEVLIAPPIRSRKGSRSIDHISLPDSSLPFVSKPELLFDVGGVVAAVVMDDQRNLWCATGSRIVPVSLNDRLQALQAKEVIHCQKPILSLAILLHSDVLVGGSVSGEIFLWRLKEDRSGVVRVYGKVKKLQKGTNEAVLHLVYAASHSLLLSCDSTGLIGAWHYVGDLVFKSAGTISFGSPVISLQARVSVTVGVVVVDVLIVASSDSFLLPLDLFSQPRRVWGKVASDHRVSGLVGQQLSFVFVADEAGSLWMVNSFNGAISVAGIYQSRLRVREELQLTGACCAAYPISRSRCVVVGAVRKQENKKKMDYLRKYVIFFFF